MAAASPSKDYEALGFENSSGKEKIFLKNFRSDRGATHASYWWKAAPGTTITARPGGSDSEPNEQGKQNALVRGILGSIRR
jgi:hypothetical protein